MSLSHKPIVGIIGLTGHAQRLRVIIEPIANITHIYHPSKKINDSRCTQELKDLVECDAIFIASPNDTHLLYLKKLRELCFSGYIFCEKPPVSHNEINELCELFDNDNKRIYFNFQYAYAKSFMLLDDLINTKALGEIISISFKAGHGLALEERWGSSWRSDGSRHMLGVVETLGVHFIERAIAIWSKFGYDIAHASMLPIKLSCVGTAIDTADIDILHHSANDTSLIRKTNIFVSYAVPFMFEMNAIGTDGIFSIKDGELIISQGRRTFDNRGYFIQPAIIERYKYDAEVEYEKALSCSVMNFISYVHTKTSIPSELYASSIMTMKLLHELHTTCVVLNSKL